jgi:hypothetical protein
MFVILSALSDPIYSSVLFHFRGQAGTGIFARIIQDGVESWEYGLIVKVRRRRIESI